MLEPHDHGASGSGLAPDLPLQKGFSLTNGPRSAAVKLPGTPSPKSVGHPNQTDRTLLISVSQTCLEKIAGQAEPETVRYGAFHLR